MKLPAPDHLSLGSLITANALLRVAGSAAGQLFALDLAARHAGSWAVAVTGACFYATELLGAPLAGRLADLGGQRPILTLGPVLGVGAVLVGTCAPLAGESVVGRVALLGLASLIAGACTASTTPTTLTLLSRATEEDPRHRTQVMAWFEATTLVGMFAGYALGGAAWDRFHTHAFALLAPVYLVALVLLVMGTPREAPDAHHVASESSVTMLRALLRVRGAVGFALAWLSVNAVVGLWVQHFPYLLSLTTRARSQRLVGGFSGTQIGGIFGAFGALFVAGMLLWARGATRWPRRRTMAVGVAGMLGAVAVIAAFNHGAPFAVLGLGALCVLIESGFTPSALAYLADITHEQNAARSTAMGIYSLLLGAGQLLGIVLGGPLATRWKVDGVLGLTAAFALTAFAGLARMPTHLHARRAGAGSGPPPEKRP